MIGWDVSTSPTNMRDNFRTLQATRAPIMAKTQQETKRVFKDKKYSSPEALSANLTANLRQKKIDDKDLVAEMKNKVRYELPRSSEEVITATTLRKIYEI